METGMDHIRLSRAVGVVLGTAMAVGTATAQVPDEAAADQGTVLEEIVVTGRQRTAAEQVLQERIDAPVVKDLVSIEQISRVGDSTVSLALRRLPGVTIVGDQFIYIRGLGERYSSTTVNGAYVPSPDLTRNVVPLDLFPAEIVQSLAIQKGYSVDKPAAFGGGNVDIRTRTVPEDLQFSLQLGTGWNSDSGSDGLSYPGGSDDEWGTDDGTRALPAAISQAIQDYQGDISVNGIFRALQRDGQFHSIEEAQAINRDLALSLNRTLDPSSESLDPDLSLEVSAGNSWFLGESGQWKVGLLALGDYKNQWRNRERINRSASLPDDDVDFTLRTTHQVTMTGSLGVGLEFADEQKIDATVIYLRNTEDDASITTGNNFNFRREDGRQLRNHRVRYEERELELVQLRGSHRLGPETLGLLDGILNLEGLNDLAFEWYWSDAKAKTDLPSELQFSFQDSVDPVSGQVLSTSMRPSATAAEYRFTDLEDTATSYGTKVTFPLRFGTMGVALTGGYDYYEKGRGYLQTQLNIGSTSAPTSVLQGTPAEVFTDANILSPANGFGLTIGGIGTESYLAGETVTGVFGNVDLDFNEVWRLSAGVRWEDFERVTVPVDPLSFDIGTGKILVPPDQLASIASTSDDYYPAAAITWSKPDFWADDFQLRFGYSQTVARPDLREVSGATYIDPLTEARVRGNPALLNSDLTNFDLRGEWFFGGGDNLTVSLFYKDITDPIETVEGAGTDDNVSLTFINGDSAEVYGIEIEGLKSLGFLTDGGWSDAFFVSGNVTISDSEITIGAAAPGLTNNTRRLTQHSPLVINLQLGYDSPGGAHSASLVYGMYDERVFFAGRGGAPDAYEEPFHSLDVVYTWYPADRLSVKFRAQNILDEKTEISQGGVIVLEQTIGTNLKLDFTYKF
jgi:TonB-dependent receptor